MDSRESKKEKIKMSPNFLPEQNGKSFAERNYRKMRNCHITGRIVDGGVYSMFLFLKELRM
jgi:hypothetical protein